MRHCSNLSPCFGTKKTIYRSENAITNCLSTTVKSNVSDHTFFHLSLQLLHVYLQYQGLSIIRKNPISYSFAARYAHGVWKCYHKHTHTQVSTGTEEIHLKGPYYGFSNILVNFSSTRGLAKRLL